MNLDDHIMSWTDADHLVDCVAVLAELGQKAAVEAVGTDPESRADHAVQLLREKSVLAGYQLADAAFTQVRADCLADFNG